MLQRIGNIFRTGGLLAFVIMCYAWFLTSNLQLFLIAKQCTIFFFCASIAVWLLSIVVAKLNK